MKSQGVFVYSNLTENLCSVALNIIHCLKKRRKNLTERRICVFQTGSSVRTPRFSKFLTLKVCINGYVDTRFYASIIDLLLPMQKQIHPQYVQIQQYLRRHYRQDDCHHEHHQLLHRQQKAQKLLHHQRLILQLLY